MTRRRNPSNQTGMNNLAGIQFTDIIYDEAEEINEDFFETLFRDPLIGWGPYGFGSPPLGSWRTKTGRVMKITEMDDEHITNSMRFLALKFPREFDTWPVYKELSNEIMKRIENARTDWDN